MALSIRDVALSTSLSCETILEGMITPSALEPEVVRHIMHAVRTSGYLETFARWKESGPLRAVAILTPWLDSASGTETYRGIDRALSALGLNVTILSVPTRGSLVIRESVMAEILVTDKVDAVIALNMIPSAGILARFRDAGKPVILLETRADDAQSVLLENARGMSIGINYLAGQGHGRIAMMNGPTTGTEPSAVASERLIGYLTALQRRALPFDETLVFESRNYDTDAGFRAFEYFYENGPLPDAVFCATGDMSALGFMNAARERGVRIPEDVAVMGYDDLPVASLVNPGITTIRQRLMIAGAGALVLALESAVNGPGENLVIIPELVVRGTA